MEGRVLLFGLIVLVAFSAWTDAAVYGLNNIMYRRYPNGPKEYHRMPVVVFRPSAVPARSRPDSSWMFQRKGHFPTSRRF